MPVKHWSFAGLLLTYWCNARCASCYVCSSPQAGGDMSVEAALAFWEGLQRACPHGCRIHIGGGEPFGRWEVLIELARRARRQHLGPLEAVETNAFWATGEGIVRRRLAALDAAGMGRLAIAADPYHQQYVPIERVRLAASVAEEVLGAQRVRVRWRDWARDGFDTDSLPPQRRQALFRCYAVGGRDRLAGRAAAEIAGLLPLEPAAAFADSNCRARLLRSRHVHIDGEGILCPGTCAGIILGRASRPESIARIWQTLDQAFADKDETSPPLPGLEIIGLLARRGPAALLDVAGARGYVPRPEGYAHKCQLCWDVRRWLFEKGYFRDQLGPEVTYTA
jgi:hypothetical protein